MKAPFSALIKSLQSVFHLEVIRNGKYSYPAVEQLQEAMAQYDPEAKKTFIALQKAIKKAMPHIQKRLVNLEAIKTAMDTLASEHQVPSLDWSALDKQIKSSSRFKFNPSHLGSKSTDLITWISTQTGKQFFQMEPHEITQALIENKHKLGFSQKLSSYLKKNPDFLFYLIMDSDKNFIKICDSRLILYLTDQQIAKTIMKHLHCFVHENSDLFEEVELLVHTLNDILSKGRSISTLMRNAQAKPILLNSIYFQLYQSKGFATHQKQLDHSDVYMHASSDNPSNRIDI